MAGQVEFFASPLSSTAGTAELSAHHYSVTPCSCGQKTKSLHLLTPRSERVPSTTLADLGDVSGIEMSGRSQSVESLTDSAVCDLSSGPLCSTLMYPQRSTPTRPGVPDHTEASPRPLTPSPLRFDSFCEEDSMLTDQEVTMVMSTLSTPDRVVLKRAISDTISSVFNLNDSYQSRDLPVGASGLQSPARQPLGARPPCIGQEASPVREVGQARDVRSPVRCEDNKLSGGMTGNSKWSSLECQCKLRNQPSKSLARSSIRSSKFSPVQPNTELEESRHSDITTFMEKPLNRHPVTKETTVVVMEKSKRKSILGKLKKYCKQLQRKSSDVCGEMETLAVL